MRSAMMASHECVVAVFLSLLLTMVIALPASAAFEATGDEYVVRGLVYESEVGIVLISEDDVLYRLEGLDMSPYLESIVEVVGRVVENEFGEAVIEVSFVSQEDDTEEALEKTNEAVQ
ncbi:hypothetical protein [Desulfovibrio ferrophilus]|uniref:Uncharacterized protein n=1 Tax=Desulfovibrio ferrophilus TaxID=241368 RepID=A0A2Z6AXX6_9BACT|nr:hypothetical protein [Desulfovibrio ferrophilus]BBD08091.1 uncharacterized protein DFE_1365 [Desulfovibrio ferrophilus]